MMQEYIKTKTDEFFISTADVPFSGWETMVFPAKNGEVTDWDELYCDTYSCEEEAMQGHAKVVEFYRGS